MRWLWGEEKGAEQWDQQMLCHRGAGQRCAAPKCRQPGTRGGNTTRALHAATPPSCCESTTTARRAGGYVYRTLTCAGALGVAGPLLCGDTVLLSTVGSQLEQRRGVVGWGEIFQTPPQEEDMDEAFLRQLGEVQHPHGQPRSSQGPSASLVPARRAAQQDRSSEGFWRVFGKGWGCDGRSHEAVEVSPSGEAAAGNPRAASKPISVNRSVGSVRRQQ